MSGNIFDRVFPFFIWQLCHHSNPLHMVSLKKRGTRQQPDSSDSTALLVIDLALSIHTSIEHAQQLSLTQTHLSLLQAQTLHRAPRMEFHNSDSHKKSPPTQMSKLLEHRTKVWHLSVYDHALLRKQTTQICWSPSLLPKLLCSTTSFLTRSDSFQTQELALS
jgi:hypothetical protein